MKKMEGKLIRQNERSKKIQGNAKLGGCSKNFEPPEKKGEKTYKWWMIRGYLLVGKV